MIRETTFTDKVCAPVIGIANECLQKKNRIAPPSYICVDQVEFSDQGKWRPIASNGIRPDTSACLHLFDRTEEALSQGIEPSRDADFRTVKLRNVKHVDNLIEMGTDLRKV